jgi:WD40 repeat protein
LLRTLPGGRRLAWAPDGKQLASADQPGRIELFDGDTGQEVGRLTEVVPTASFPTSAPAALAWSPDGRRLASASTDGSWPLTPSTV